MFKPSLTIAKLPGGEIKILYAGEDAAKAVDVFESIDVECEAFVVRNPEPFKSFRKIPKGGIKPLEHTIAASLVEIEVSESVNKDQETEEDANREIEKPKRGKKKYESI